LELIQKAKQLVTVVTWNGNAYTGHVADIGAGCVGIGPLSGKTLYDAMINIADLIVLELKTR
jgi:predicted RNA methylase